MPYLPRVSHVSPQIPKMAIRGSYEAALGKGVTTALEVIITYTFDLLLHILLIPSLWICILACHDNDKR